MKKWLALKVAKTWRRRYPVVPGNEKGVSLVWFALMLPVLLGFVALVLEMGMILEIRRQLQTAVDAGALAGAQQLPNSPAQAQAVASQYVDINPSEPVEINTSVFATYAANDTISATAVQNVRLVLIPLLGYPNSQRVDATATALIGTLANYDCPLPLGIVDENAPGPDDGFGPVPGQQVTLKLGAEGNQNGNFQALRIYGQGGNDFADGIAKKKCPIPGVQQWQWIDTLPGNQVGNDTKKGFDLRVPSPVTWDYFQQHWDPKSPQLAVIPVVNTFDINGSKPVQIYGFAHFFIESWSYVEEEDKEKGGGQKKGHWEVVGRFVTVFTQGDLNPYKPLGSNVLRLIR
ncbi:MAG: Tad domain-containing protein [Chloroflexi bacterium]|nr:Tad domain-containing protein [Chloroflexota bacterium]